MKWAKSVGGGGTSSTDGYNNRGNDIAVDNNGNVYTIGTFSGTADFDPGPGIYFMESVSAPGGIAASDDIFILKQNAAGSFIWAKHIGGPNNDNGLVLKVDILGNVYLTGNFQDTVDFDPGPGVHNLISAGGQDIFVTKLDNAGNFVWARKIGGNAEDGDQLALAIDLSGNIYTTGTFTDTVDFDPGPNTANLISTGSTDVFVSKMDNWGNLIWVKQLGGILNDISKAVTVDHSGNVLVTGGFEGTSDFDPGPGNSLLTSFGGMDVFIAKLNSFGNLIWAKQLGGNGGIIDIGSSLVTDDLNNVYTTGTFGLIGGAGADFDPGPSTFILDPQYGTMFVSKLDSSGNFVWAKQIGNAGNSFANGIFIATDGAYNLYLTGTFSDTADFDPGSATATLISNSPSGDVFISKLDSSGNFVWAGQMKNQNLSSTMSVKSIASDQAQNVYTTGSFRTAADFDPGQGAYNLYSVIPGNADIFVQKVSCSSVDTISIASCNSYMNGEHFYTQSGTYSEAYINQFGCDSIVFLNVTIALVDTSIIKNGATLTALAEGATFQWVNCENFEPIPGATDHIYSATTDGDYAVIVSRNGCTDTSGCYSLNPIGTGTSTIDFPGKVQLFPNPALGEITLATDLAFKKASFCLINVLGQVLMKNKNLNGHRYSCDLTPYSPGIYIIEVREGIKIARFKFIKK